MNQKISRNEKHNNSTEGNLALDGDEKASTLIILRRRMAETFLNCSNLVNNQSSIHHLKMFKILFTCNFCFYFTFTVYLNLLNIAVFMVRKGKKKAI